MRIHSFTKGRFISALVVASLSVHASAGIVKKFQANIGPAFGEGWWDEPLNWVDLNNNPGVGVPTANDRVLIPGGLTCHVQTMDAVADTVDIESAGSDIGRLWIGKFSDARLTLDNDTCVLCTNDPTADGGDGSMIDGKLILGAFIGSGGDESVGELDLITASHIFEGGGEIVGYTGKINIDPGVRLINDIVIDASKQLIIQPREEHAYVPILHNRAMVKTGHWSEATNGGVLTLESGLRLMDTPTAVWRSTDTEGGSINFRHPATLRGSMIVGGICDEEEPKINAPNSFNFQASAKTCGLFAFNRRGDILIDGVNVKFQYALFSSNKPCGNPAQAGTGGCTTPWEINTFGHHECLGDCD